MGNGVFCDKWFSCMQFCKKIHSLKKLAMYIVKRYLRFVLLVLSGGCVTLCLFHLIKFHNKEIGEILGNGIGNAFLENPSLLRIIRFSLMDVWVYGSSVYNPPVWMMRTLFFGTVLIAVVSFVCQKVSEIDKLVWVIITIVSYLYSPYISTMITGCVLAEVNYADVKRKAESRGIRFDIIGIFLFVLCIMFFGYVRAYDGLKYFIVSVAMLIIMLLSGGLQKLLEIPLFLVPGKFSAEIFVIHFPLYCTLSSCLYLQLASKEVYGSTAYIITFLATTFSLYVLCYITHIANVQINARVTSLLRLQNKGADE